MKRGSKKGDLSLGDAAGSRCDVFTPNEAARPHFSGSRAVRIRHIAVRIALEEDDGDHEEEQGVKGEEEDGSF